MRKADHRTIVIVTILLIVNTGKTSLINTFISSTFSEEVINPSYSHILICKHFPRICIGHCWKFRGENTAGKRLVPKAC